MEKIRRWNLRISQKRWIWTWISNSEILSHWNKIFDQNGKEFKFQRSQWLDKLKDDEFRACVFDIMDEEIIKKFESEGKNFALEGESEED